MGKVKITQAEFLRRRVWFRLFRAITLITLLGAALVGGLVAGLFASVSRVLPRGDQLSDIRPATPTRVLASDGTLLARVYLPDQNREIIPISRMGYMVDATLAIEDVRFYQHPGIDLRGIARAVFKNVATRTSKEGASTITQQLARNLYLSREKKITRKLQEVILALELERRYSKEEILETYLNQVYYGTNSHSLQSWGVQMAAQNYFGKDVQDLTLAQAALLAGLPKNPRDYNPYRFMDASIKRRNMVLRIMLQNESINREQYDKAVAEQPKLAPEKPLPEMADYHAPYFVRYILVNEMKRVFGQDAQRLIYHYGVDIYTSLDPRMQKVAEETVTTGVEKNHFRRIDDGALISIDPQTGQIKAMVGGTNFRTDQYNVVTQGHRQPGSAFKPFVYTTALLHGYTPETPVFDSRRTYHPGMGSPPWTPKNSDGSYRGRMPLKRALWLSRNAAAASVAYDVGIREIIKTAYTMGIKYPLDPHLSTSLGASVVVPLEICSAYGTLANGGVHHPPTGVLRVTTTGGDVLYEYRSRPQRAIPTEVADTMQETMRGVIERGTARVARCPFPASGKTGTTNSFRDAWFIGYTDDLVTAVWVGNRHNQPMNRTFGGTVPAPIWREFMLVAQPIMVAEHRESGNDLTRLNSLPELTTVNNTPTPYILKLRGKERPRDVETSQPDTQDQAPAPAPVRAEDKYTVNICQDSGERATAWCPNTMLVTYIRGQQPTPPSKRCSVHTGPEAIPTAEGQDERPQRGRRGEQRGIVMSICAETGKIATEKCPTVLRRRFLHDAPTETCPLHGLE